MCTGLCLIISFYFSGINAQWCDCWLIVCLVLQKTSQHFCNILCVRNESQGPPTLRRSLLQRECSAGDKDQWGSFSKALLLLFKSNSSFCYTFKVLGLLSVSFRQESLYKIAFWWNQKGPAWLTFVEMFGWILRYSWIWYLNSFISPLIKKRLNMNLVKYGTGPCRPEKSHISNSHGVFMMRAGLWEETNIFSLLNWPPIAAYTNSFCPC